MPTKTDWFRRVIAALRSRRDGVRDLIAETLTTHFGYGIAADGPPAVAAAIVVGGGVLLLRIGVSRRSKGLDAAAALGELAFAATAWCVGGAALTGGASILSGDWPELLPLTFCLVWTLIACGGITAGGVAVGGRLVLAAISGGLLFPVLARGAESFSRPSAAAFHISAGAVAFLTARLLRRAGERIDPSTRIDSRAEVAICGGMMTAVGLSVGGIGLTTAILAAAAAAVGAGLLGLRVRNRVHAGDAAVACVAGVVACTPLVRADAAAVIVTSVVAGVVTVVVRRGVRRSGVADAGGPAGHLAAGLWSLAAGLVFAGSGDVLPNVFAGFTVALLAALAFAPVVWLGRLRETREESRTLVGIAPIQVEPDSAVENSAELEADLADAMEELASEQAGRGEAEKTVANLEAELKTVRAALTEMEQNLAEAEAEVASVNASTAELSDDAMWAEAPVRHAVALAGRPFRRPVDRPRNADESAFASLGRVEELLSSLEEDRPVMSHVVERACEAPVEKPVELDAATDLAIEAFDTPNEAVIELETEPQPSAAAYEASLDIADSTPAAISSPVEAEPWGGEPLPDVEPTFALLDSDELRRRCLGDEEFYVSVLEQLTVDLPAELAAIEASLGQEDFAAAAEVADRVKRFAADAAAGELLSAFQELIEPLHARDWDKAAARYVVAYDSARRTAAAVGVLLEDAQVAV